jgi:hypothetical protein
VLSWVLGIAALLAGATGAWSPCGFSMVETLAPAGYADRLRTTLAACLTFAAGALAGGVLTFGGLALLGRALGAGGTTAAAVAALIAVSAAAGEARGLRIVPQVRRQVPESWRRVLPMTLAAGGYGVLLGLGFTTFILTFAVWALAAISVALGEPQLGLVVGLAFGAGRALPVLALAPLAGTDAGHAAATTMAERPAILRGLRAADAVALVLCAVAIGAAPAQAATVVSVPAGDPSAEGALLAWQYPGGPGVLRRADASLVALPGRDPVLAAGLIGWREPGRIVLAAPDTLSPVAAYDVPGAGRFAFSAGWLVWLVTTPEGGQAMLALPRDGSLPARMVALAEPPIQIGRPALQGGTLLFHRTGGKASELVQIDLPTGARRIVRRERRAQLLAPSLLGDVVLYVRSTASYQELRLGRLGLAINRPDHDRLLYRTTPTARRDRGVEPGHHEHRAGYPGHKHPPSPPRPRDGITDTLWNTALSPDRAYVTRLRRLRGLPTTAALLSVPRG